MREDHRGFPSYLSVYPALFWRPASPRPRLSMNVCKSLLRVATQKNPNRIPEWEQRLRRSRTRDEGKPYGFSLMLNCLSLLGFRRFFSGAFVGQVLRKLLQAGVDGDHSRASGFLVARLVAGTLPRRHAVELVAHS